MKTNLLKQFNLPSYIKDKTFANASKAIEKKFKDRNDKISLETKYELLKRLANAQEFIKQNEEYSNEMFLGGFMDKSNQAINQAGIDSYMQGAETLFTSANDIFGKTGIDANQGDYMKDENTALNTGMGLAKGALAGVQIAGPLGAGIGGVIGGIGSFIGSKRKNKDIREANHNTTLKNNAQLRESDFKYGGNINSYNNGGNLDEIFKAVMPEKKQFNFLKDQLPNAFSNYNKGVDMTALDKLEQENKIYNLSDTKAFVNNVNKRKPIITKEKSETFNKGLDWLGENYGNILRYAPVAANAIELAKLRKDNVPRGSRLDNVYKPNNFDEAALLNMINQSNITGALTNASTGDAGALRSNLVAADINKKKALSDAFLQGENINRDENRFAFENNLRKDLTNVQLDQDFINRQDQTNAAFENNKSALKRALYEDIGNIGKEEVNKKQVKEMFGYKWDGKYYVDKKGNKYTPNEVKQRIILNQNMYGGYLKK